MSQGRIADEKVESRDAGHEVEDALVLARKVFSRIVVLGPVRKSWHQGWALGRNRVVDPYFSKTMHYFTL